MLHRGPLLASTFCLMDENAFRAEAEICCFPRFSAATSDFLSSTEPEEVLGFVGRERSRLDSESFADDMAILLL
jgi:hypothetical protein